MKSPQSISDGGKSGKLLCRDAMRINEEVCWVKGLKCGRNDQ